MNRFFITCALILCASTLFADSADIAPSLATLMSLRLGGHKAGDTIPEGTVIEVKVVNDEHFDLVTSQAKDTWKSFLSRYYKGVISVRQSLPLVFLANQQKLKKTAIINDKVVENTTYRLPKVSAIGDPALFIADLSELLTKAFNTRVGEAGFKELELRYHILHDMVLPLALATRPSEKTSARNPLKQLTFDFRLLTALRSVNNQLFKLLQQKRKRDWELAWKIHDDILSIQHQMAASLDDSHIVVKEALKIRLETYLSKFRKNLERELRRRRRRLAAALSRGDVEKARSYIQGMLYQLKPAIGGIIPLQRERSLYKDLCRMHRRYIGPVTRERSLAFTNHFNRLAALLAPPSNRDNYKLGFKISDVEFQFLKRSGTIVLHTDCSGFIGRIYRELARIAGFDMKRFIVRDSGIIGSIYMIEPKVSKKLTLAKGPNPYKEMKQGDFFYFERKIRGKRQRHVVFFDRLVEVKGEQKVSLWEASPGGVKHRIKPLNWILRWVRSSYGAPRSGVYRMKEMDKIDSILDRRGFIF